MQDSSRAEELRRIIHERVNACDKRKWMRGKRTFWVLSGAVYVISIYHGLKSDKVDIDIEYLLSWLVASPVLAGLIMFISMLVLLYIIAGALEDEKAIARLIGRLDEAESINNK